MDETYVFGIVGKCEGIERSTIVSFNFMTLRHPNCEMTLSRIGITVLAETELTISTTGYRECSSIITNRYSPVGSGPQKSALKFSHAFSGISDILRGSMEDVFAYVAAWHAIQLLIVSSTCSSTRGNHIFDLMNDFVRLIP